MHDDSVLVRGLRAGDDRAFTSLVERYQDPVFRMCRRYLPHAEAEDVAQETFVRVLLHAGTLDPHRPVQPWLFAVGRRLCIDRLRKRSPDPASDDPSLDVAASGPNPERDAMTTERLRRLERALASLPEGQREAVALFHLEGLSYELIAASLSVPLGTVMTWLHRGRSALRRAVEGDDERAD